MNKITIKAWDKKRFENSCEEWTDLVRRSNADQLFLSWEWQYTWWQVFAIPKKMQLRLYVAIDEKNNLIGIAPLFLSIVPSTKLIRTKRLQFIGNCWRSRDTMRTELLDFIVARERSKETIQAFFEYIHASRDWDEFVMVNLRKDSETYAILTKDKPLPDCHLRNAEEYASYYLNTNGNFKGYLNNLSKTTRLRIFNRRKILENTGNITFGSADENDIDSQFELLNKLHYLRWKKSAFSDDPLKFNKMLATLLAKKNALCFSILCIDSMPKSIQYNYHINNHLYNLQAGFDPSFHKKLALGYLHFGYEIEKAFNDQTTAYDFLAGEGQNTPYKENLTNTKLDIVDLQIIRNKLLQLLYKTYHIFNKFKKVG